MSYPAHIEDLNDAANKRIAELEASLAIILSYLTSDHDAEGALLEAWADNAKRLLKVKENG